MKKFTIIPITLFLLTSCSLPFSAPQSEKPIESSTGSQEE